MKALQNVRSRAVARARNTRFVAGTVAVFGSLMASPLMAAAPTAAGTNPLTDATALFKNGMTLAVTLGGAAVVLVAIAVIISSLMQVARDRKTWGEVMGAVIGAGIIAILIGGLVVYATTQITAIAV